MTMPHNMPESARTEPDTFSIEVTEGAVPLCSPCRERGRCRLGISSVTPEEDVVIARVRCGPDGRGAPTVAHGGWIASVFDDVLAYAALRENPRVVTSELNVRYRRPVPVSQPLLVRSRVLHRSHTRWTLQGEMFLEAAVTDAAVLAQASATFVARASNHFERAEEWIGQLKESTDPRRLD